MLASCGVLLLLLGGFLLWRKPGSQIGAAMLVIGALSVGGGAVATLALTNGQAAQWAFWAVVGALLAALGPRAGRAGFALLAVGFALFCLDVLLNQHPMWLSTLGIIMLVLGVAALVRSLGAMRAHTAS